MKLADRIILDRHGVGDQNCQVMIRAISQLCRPKVSFVRGWPGWILGCALLFVSSSLRADCYAYGNARDHLGEVACIKGKVVKVTVSPGGLHFLNFCEDYKKCPFTVVVFPRDLRDVGDVRALEGKEVEVNGKIRSYRGQVEIILRDISQLRGEAANIPNLPKGYDVTRKGSFSAGTFKGPKSSTTQKTTKKGRNDPTFPDD